MDFPWQDLTAACLVIVAVAYLARRFLWPRTRTRHSNSCPSCDACPAATHRRGDLDITRTKRSPPRGSGKLALLPNCLLSYDRGERRLTMRAKFFRLIHDRGSVEAAMSTKETIAHELDRLSEAELRQVARYVAFLKYQARVEAAPRIDEQGIAALYAESGDEDRNLAEEGLADYARALQQEDAQ